MTYKLFICSVTGIVTLALTHLYLLKINENILILYCGSENVEK